MLGNLASDIYWQSVIANRVVPRLLALRRGPDAIDSQLRDLISGYVAGYNGYLASVGGAKGVPDLTCRGKPWVKPITVLDEYLRIYQVVELEGEESFAAGLAAAQPLAKPARAAHPPPSGRGLAALARRFAAARAAIQIGSNAIAIGSAGARDHEHGILLGNPHYPWSGPQRFYQVQLTIPGQLNVEGATLFGIPLVVIGYTSTLAWSYNVSPAWTYTLYQLTLVPSHRTEYIYGRKALPMTSRTVIVTERLPAGKLRQVRHTLWYSRYGPIIANYGPIPTPWTTREAFAMADANAANFRFLNGSLATDQASSVAQELSVLKKYQGLPWVNTIAADSTGHALFADIQPIPDVTDAEANRCDTATGQVLFTQTGLPVLNGSLASCTWGTDKDSAAPGILGPAEEPVLQRRDFVENSNDSYWMTNPAHPLTGFPRIVGQAGTGLPGSQGADLGLRTRSALTMIMSRIAGADGLGPAGFTFTDMKNLMYSDIQYGATLVKPALVHMCESFPHGQAPLSGGHTIPVGDSCQVLASWNGRENPGSRGAFLFRQFWGEVIRGRGADPWSHPFNPADPVHTPYGFDTAGKTIQEAFGDALAAVNAQRLPYNVALDTVQYVLAGGRRIPLPGGPGDPYGDFNAVWAGRGQPVTTASSSYIQVVNWTSGNQCPLAATVLTYSESANPASPHYADQTELFSRRQWATGWFCSAQVAAHAVSTTVLHGR